MTALATARRVLPGLLALALYGCGSCGRDASMAELLETLGTVQRDSAGAPGAWSRAASGERLAVGDGLRTGARSRAELELLPSGHLRVEADTVVRFAKTPPARGQGRLELEAGAIELESRTAAFEIQSPAGSARLGSGSRVRVRADARKTAFDLAVGRVLLEQDGQTRELHAGQSFELAVGAALVEPAPAPPPAAAAVAVDAGAATPVAALPQGFDVPPAQADLELAAGESASIHDPSPPTAVRIAFPGCAQGLALEVTRASGEPVTRVRGQDGAIAALPSGQLRYRVRCAAPNGAFSGRAAAEGRLQVVRDAATRKLPTTAPAVNVAADGRRYTVRYQNLPPQLALRWPDAPRASAYTLELRAGTRALLRERSSTPSVTLASGRIEEGSYAFHFEADGMRSAEGMLSVVFDNTARVAYLAEPREREFAAGGDVRVAGAALRGARVEIDGKPLPVQSQGRFDTRVALPLPHSALAVRVQHASTGVHYFLRHAAE